MKKIALVALLGLFAAVPGMAAINISAVEQHVNSAEIDPVLAEAILSMAASEIGGDADQLINDYYAGVVIIEKIANGYRVIQTGGLAIILLEDEI